jgi:hypothetical protein
LKLILADEAFSVCSCKKKANEEEAHVKIIALESQEKRLKHDGSVVFRSTGQFAIEDGRCGAEGCGKGNIGQFESVKLGAMREHCSTNKHKVLDSAQLCFLCVILFLFIFLCYSLC